ncbi:MAG: hypothetical protein CO093_05465 [Alphaproteobacteria bacterium CG_4_9_14_3_um_filter_47_13]|nr:MAG: hypothetical protein CO093_05465 [Alphaproteobacteria bacterium CG_4_9_14_3_um_filter_47_13]
MPIPFLTPVRTVLLIGDEALYIYKVTHNATKFVDSVPWQVDEFEETVVDFIRKDCGGKPVLILNDMTDQHFKGGQRMPKVGAMDQGNMVKRKLQVAFPNYPIRGALPVKGKDGKSIKGKGIKQAGGLFLFAAVPLSEPVVKTMEAVRLSMVSIAGFVLLPVEASDMVKALSEKIAGRARRAAKWVIFIGQHQSGALRQVITRDGQLAMTRMTPVFDTESDPESWAQEVNQEFKATISYLSRFGYTPEDGTDVVVVAGSEAGSALEKLISVPCDFKSFTVPEAARLLGMSVGLQAEPRYAEPLHVAWAGRKSKFILPMESVDITKVHKPRQAVAAAMFLLILGGGFLAWQLLGKTQEMMMVKEGLANQRVVLSQAEFEYEEEVKKMALIGFDVNLIRSTIKTYEEFEGDSIQVLPFFKKIGETLGNDLRLDSFAVAQIYDSGKPSQRHDGKVLEKRAAKLEAELQLSFPSTIQPESGMTEITNLASRLKEALPDYDVVITRQVARPEYDQNIKGVAGRSAQEIASEEDYIAKLLVRGPK